MEIRCGDFSTVGSCVSAPAFYYIDPPYRPLTKTSAFTGYSEKGFDQECQIRLASFCRELSANGICWWCPIRIRIMLMQMICFSKQPTKDSILRVSTQIGWLIPKPPVGGRYLRLWFEIITDTDQFLTSKDIKKAQQNMSKPLKRSAPALRNKGKYDTITVILGPFVGATTGGNNSNDERKSTWEVKTRSSSTSSTQMASDSSSLPISAQWRSLDQQRKRLGANGGISLRLEQEDLQCAGSVCSWLRESQNNRRLTLACRVNLKCMGITSCETTMF